MQVVRYHSLVIDAKSLPKELIPLAWTCSTDTVSSLVDQKSYLDAYESQPNEETSPSSFYEDFMYGGSSLRSNSVEGMPDKKVLMGIMHSTRPHYGLQVRLDLFLRYQFSQL